MTYLATARTAAVKHKLAARLRCIATNLETQALALRSYAPSRSVANPFDCNADTLVDRAHELRKIADELKPRKEK